MSDSQHAVADWRPTAAAPAWQARAGMLRRIRAFFLARDVLEVCTPVVTAAGLADPHILSYSVVPGEQRYLHTSPEYAMKRLLAAGSGDIYQICQVFRAGEQGRLHNPEFSLLEWYRLGFDLRRLMDEVAELVGEILDCRLAAVHISYRQAFLDALGLDPLTAPDTELVACARAARVAPPDSLDPGDRDAWLDWLMSVIVAPGFAGDRLTLVYGYPASQCALARIEPGPPPTAARFEAYWGAVELANGYHELTDADEQRLRFEAERNRRLASGQAAPQIDGRLLGALRAGLPDCAGVALGLDRLLMLMLGADHIEQVLAFPWDRA